MIVNVLWNIQVFTIWFLSEENQTREREVFEQTSRSLKYLHERGVVAHVYIDTAIGKSLLKICTMLRKAMLFHFIYLVYIRC